MVEEIEKKEDAKEQAGGQQKEGPAGKEKPGQSPASKKRKKPKEPRISEEELSELKEKAALADEYYDRLLRLQADFENFRKRKEKERLETIKYANEALVCELVPILTNFERGTSSGSSGSSWGISAGLSMGSAGSGFLGWSSAFVDCCTRLRSISLCNCWSSREISWTRASSSRMSSC